LELLTSEIDQMCEILLQLTLLAIGLQSLQLLK